MEETRTKICDKCEVERDVTDFYKRSRYKSVQYWSRSCRFCDPATKVCAECSREYPLSDFNKTGKGCRNRLCRFCSSTATLHRSVMRPDVYQNPHRIEGRVAYIGLTNRAREIVAEAIIDADDLDAVISLGRWHKARGRNTAYVSCTLKGRGIQLHRFLLSPPDDKDVDHINGSGLDNRRANLRIVGDADNRVNCHRPSRGRTGVRNVYPFYDGRFFVKFWQGGKQYHFGYFDTLEAASLVAIEAKKLLWGEIPTVPPLPPSQ
jgi:hypothetical protein